ncbi:bacillithiol biosynthesis deacetylase BshB2 [Evansella cellulosilytica]|uniref:LmbE family protein n=1 Tax=Evansella cellulosilytica (strain ATCC 21833 / DSM 2522 / FERM P-1141 / JCM 9156 / N-4) TaxID=649639 RepID=E6TY59_EVAC2|nr:bacillithiol biosynthesis deacetylase BshB2 [Evansella cellulosilytica]ADU32378.1 LmbE family protein [Evansella cellulosilytica DSM 2522]
MERHVLVVFPHPDDEAFGVAGTILSHTEAGTPVTYICLTLGEMGRNMGRPLIANRETLPEIRKKELDEACRLLGIKDLRRFGLRDKTVEFTDQEKIINHILEVINEVNPSLIITFYPGYAVHPDHDATGAAVVQAVLRLNKEQRPKIHAIAFSEGSEAIIGSPDVINDVSAFAERKIAVLEAHESQTANFIPALKKGYAQKEEAAIERLTKESFWTYPISDEDV